MGKMLSRRQMQHLCICLALGLLLCSLWQAAAWSRTQLHTGDAVCADTLRLHIRAASDAVADQSAKLRVRDAVLAVMQQCRRKVHRRRGHGRRGGFCSFSWRRSGR